MIINLHYTLTICMVIIGKNRKQSKPSRTHTYVSVICQKLSF